MAEGIADRRQQIVVAAGEEGVGEAAAGVVEPRHRGVVRHVPAGDDVVVPEEGLVETAVGEERGAAGVGQPPRGLLLRPAVGDDDDGGIARIDEMVGHGLSPPSAELPSRP